MDSDLLTDLWRALLALAVAAVTALLLRLRKSISQPGSPAVQSSTREPLESAGSRMEAIWEWLRPRIRADRDRWWRSVRVRHGWTRGKPSTRRSELGAGGQTSTRGSTGDESTSGSPR